MRYKVLVVEDDHLIAQLTEVWLRHAGFDVELAYDGQAGLDAAMGRPDLVILDIRLPRLDGFEVLRAMKDDPTLRDVPVIVFSAHVQEMTRQRAIEGGASCFLAKPFEPSDLIKAVTRCLGDDHAAHPPAARSPTRGGPP